MKYRISTVFVVALAFFLSAATAMAGSDKVIGEGSKVSIEYTLTIDDDKVVDSNVGKAPLVYEQGKGMIIPGLESRLTGLKVNDTKKVTVPAEEAYGPVNPKGFQEIPKEQIPEEALKAGVGAQLQAKTQSGQNVAFRLHEIKEDTVVVDLNHPLAGKELTFDVKIIDVQ